MSFRFHSEPCLSVEESLNRRDFTVNAMGHEPMTGELIDPFGGQEDLRANRELYEFDVCRLSPL